jgi:hypothetical protein
MRLKKDVEHKETARHALEQVRATAAAAADDDDGDDDGDDDDVGDGDDYNIFSAEVFPQQVLQLKTEISVLRDKLADESKRSSKADAARAVAEAAAAEAQAAVQVA